MLSGKIICGECGSTYAGNARKTRDKLYISYMCTKKNGKVKCNNSGIQRDYIENIVLTSLADKVFNKSVLPEIIKKYNDFALSKNQEYSFLKDGLKLKITENAKEINNIIKVMRSTGSATLAKELEKLELEKSELEQSLLDVESKISSMRIDESKIKIAFDKAKKMLKTGTLKNRKSIVEQYVKQIMVYKDKITIEYSIGNTYSIREEIAR